MKRSLCWIQAGLALALLKGSLAGEGLLFAEVKAAPPENTVSEEKIDLRAYLASGRDVNAKDEDGMTLLMKSALTGAVEDVKLLLNAGAEVDLKNKNGVTALRIAADFLNLSVIGQLISAGADVNAANFQGETALFGAAAGGYEFAKSGKATQKALPVVSALISAKADVNHRSNREDTPLIVASLSKSPERVSIIEALIAAGADPNVQNRAGFSPLMMAAAEGSEDVVSALLKAGANASFRGRHQNNALHTAALTGQAKTAKLLIEAGADVNAVDQNGETPLMTVISNDDHGTEEDRIQIVKALVAAKTNLDFQDEQGEYALLIAVKTQQKAIQKLLLDAGANPKLKNEQGVSAEALLNGAEAEKADEPPPKLDLPVTEDAQAEIEKLIAAGADINDDRTGSMGALQRAAFRGNLKGVKALLKAGLDPRHRFMMPALHAAADGLQWPILKAFIDAGADVNLINAAGENALFNVIRGGHAFQNSDHKKPPRVKTLPIVKGLIKAGIDVNYSSKYEGFTPIMVTALSHSPERAAIAKELIASGANVNAQNKSGYTALIMAAGEGKEDVLKILIKAGADVNAQSRGGKNALLLAAYMGRTSIVKLLLKAGANPNLVDQYGASPLNTTMTSKEGSEKDRIQIAKALIAAKADVNFQDQEGDYALLLAVKTGQKALQKFLTDAGADPKLKNNRGESAEEIQQKIKSEERPQRKEVKPWEADDPDAEALLKAAFEGDLNAITAAISKGTPVDARSKEGDPLLKSRHTPLMLAAARGHLDAVRLLLKSGADVNARDSHQATALMRLSDSHFEIAKLLIEAGADVNARDHEGMTALELFCMSMGSARLVQILLDAGANPNVHDDAIGWSPLRYAVMFGNLESVRALIAAGADVNIRVPALRREGEGTTPLIAAASDGRFEIAKLLIEAKADLNIADDDGWTPLMVAFQRQNWEMAQFFIDSGADLNAKNKNGMTVLMNAIYASSPDGRAIFYNGAELSMAIIPKVIDVNARNNRGETALMFASEEGLPDVTKMLIEYGADATLKDHSGKTALMKAKDDQIRSIFEFYGFKE